MANRTWNPGAAGDWYGNWTTAPPDPNTCPQLGDTVAIPSGIATISAADQTLGPVNHETITLGGPSIPAIR